MKKIFVIGSINIDLSIRAPYLPQKGETLTGGGFITAHGGKGANQAVAAARLGGEVIMCGCVGKDDFGKAAVNSLRAEGIDVSNIRVIEDCPTGSAVIIVIDGDNRIILDRGANERMTAEQVDETLRNANCGDILLVQLENPTEIIGHALKTGREKGMYVILNPAPANAEISPYLDFCDLVIPNETEAEILGGRKALSERVKNLIVTVGGDGFEHYEEGQPILYPCIPVKVVDTTAAGDTFCGGLCTRLAKGDDLIKAARYGGAAASLACTRKGAQPSIPTAEETANFLRTSEITL